MNPNAKKSLYSLGEGKRSQRALDNFLRNSYRTHTTLSTLADRKANIMIRFNSILISILIVFFNNIVEINPAALISGIAFLITALISLAFATLAAKPHITKIKKSTGSHSLLKQNIFFFGNFVDFQQTDYENAFSEMMKDVPLIYGNMARDLFHLGKVLNQKFKYLKWSYNIFLIGLTFTVIAFLLSFFNSIPG